MEKSNRNPKMEHDFFRNLPKEIMIDIFSRLPLQSITSCKRVSKSWRYLTKTREFADSHFSRSVPFLALFQSESISKRYKIIEFVDTQNSGQNQCNMVLNFTFSHEALILSSANGLLFLEDIFSQLFICNPISREYIKLPPYLQGSIMDRSNHFGFGVSKLSGEYKVVRLFYEGNHRTTPRKCEVYSLRRGSWRSVETAGDQLWHCQGMSVPISLNGNLHWLVGEYTWKGQFRGGLCFDLETERFSTFSIPNLDHDYRSICALGDCLCLCDNSRDGCVIWLMNKHGDDKSWTKEFVIEIQGPYQICGGVVPIKVFKDGDILFVDHLITKLCCYSSKTRTIREIDDAGLSVMVGTRPCIYTPNFLSLKTFTIENNVISF